MFSRITNHAVVLRIIKKIFPKKVIEFSTEHSRAHPPTSFPFQVLNYSVIDIRVAWQACLAYACSSSPLHWLVRTLYLFPLF